ncbi:MAG: hypothetical protein MMC33_010002 [Icmadophila ericetorum]|nr:hypothetical protein [Icmadophila ericetorum]
MLPNHTSTKLPPPSPAPLHHEPRYERHLLHAEDARELQYRGLLSAPFDGKYKMCPSAHNIKPETYCSTYIRVCESPYAFDHHEVKDFGDIPVYMESIAAFQFLGFDLMMATELWKHWTEIPDGSTNPYDDYEILDLAMDHLESFSSEDAKLPSDDWDGVLYEIGIEKKLRNVILAEQFTPVRFVGNMTALSIVGETLELRSDELKALHDASWARAEGLKEHREKLMTKAEKLRQVDDPYQIIGTKVECLAINRETDVETEGGL